MTTVIRTDRAALRKPEITQQGFYRADAHVARVGIYEYRNDDGTVRRELRSHEEVSDPASLASYDTAPVTLQHPRNPDGTPGEVTAENVRRLKVGTLAGAARMDDDHVAATIQVEDADAIRRAKAGTKEVSPGYRIELDERAGADARYGYPGNPEGRYDAAQRQIRVNHVALVDYARGGRTTRLRMDSSDVDLTSIAKGHQHSIDCHPMGNDWNGQPLSSNSGCTSYAVSEGADSGHTHDWVRSADGVIVIAMSEGHTHAILEDEMVATPFVSPRPDSQFDRSGTGREHGSKMTQQPTPTGGSAPPPDAAEQIRLLTVRADEAHRLQTEQQTRADAEHVAAVGLRAELATSQERIKTLEAQLAAGYPAVETAAVQEQRKRADAAEFELGKLRAEQPAVVRKRANLVAKAMAVLGSDFRADGLSDRDILVAGIRNLRPREDTGPHVEEAYLARRFDSLVEDRTTYAASVARASESMQVRNDSAAPQVQNKPRVTWADQWKTGAGRYATSHRKDS